MEIPANVVEDLEPRIHSIIKKQLGFSEPTLLTAAMQVLKTGATREILTSEFSRFKSTKTWKFAIFLKKKSRFIILIYHSRGGLLIWPSKDDWKRLCNMTENGEDCKHYDEFWVWPKMNCKPLVLWGWFNNLCGTIQWNAFIFNGTIAYMLTL